MEILQFSNNVEMVAHARRLLEPGNYKYSRGVSCYYRRDFGDEDGPRRCIFGRLMYGHIPEDHRFWDVIENASTLIDDEPVFKEKFPWMDGDVADFLQSMHDDMAQNWTPAYTWEYIETMAMEADKGE